MVSTPQTPTHGALAKFHTEVTLCKSSPLGQRLKAKVALVLACFS